MTCAGSGLPAGQHITGLLNKPGQVNTYTFVGSAGARMLARMTVVSGKIWAGVKVFDPGGTKLCEETGAGQLEIADRTLPSDGTCTVLAYNPTGGSGTGEYSLTVRW